MSWTLDASNSGTQTATIGTEHSLVTNTTNGTFVLEVDTAALVNGDLLELRLYTKTLVGDSADALAWKGTFQHAQIAAKKISPPVASDISIRATLKQVAGTGRAFPWKLLRM